MKRYIITLVFGFILLIIGVCYLMNEFSSLSFVNSLSDHGYKEKQIVYKFDIKEESYRFFGNNSYITKEVSQELHDQIVVKIVYYPDFSNLSYYENSRYGNNPVKNVVFEVSKKENNFFVENIGKLLIRDLKNNKIHNYGLLIKPNIVVTVPLEKENRVTVIEYNDWMDDFFEDDE